MVLFQGQVTRAQEAEENYVIKRELAVVRQQCSSASESLEKAQDTIRELQQQKVGTGRGPQTQRRANLRRTCDEPSSADRVWIFNKDQKRRL